MTHSYTNEEEANDPESGLLRNATQGSYSLGSGFINMNKLSNSRSKLRKDESKVIVDWICDRVPEFVSTRLETIWYRRGLKEIWDKHSNKIILVALVCTWYVSAIFSITTSKVVMIKVKMPYTLCTAQFIIATLITSIYGRMWPRENENTISIVGGSIGGRIPGVGDEPSRAGIAVIRDRSISSSISGESTSPHSLPSSANEDDKYQNKVYNKEPVALAQALFRGTSHQYGWILYKIAISYTCGFLFTNIAFSVVTTSFAETVKSGEPISSVIMAFFVLREIESLPTYLCLVPICIGVACSCLHDDSFNSFGFACAAFSNLCFSMRAVYAKLLIKQSKASIDEVTLFGYISLIGLCMLVPVALFMEGSEVYAYIVNHWDANVHGSRTRLLLVMIYNGIAYTCYNTMSFLVLTRTNLITHAVLNCIRRVVVIIFTSIFFELHISGMNMVGVCIAVLGVISFAYFKTTTKSKIRS